MKPIKLGTRALAVSAVIAWGILDRPLWGQWTGGPTGPIYYTGGNVGIGASSPSTSLQIGNAVSYNQDARITMATANGAGQYRSWSIRRKIRRARILFPELRIHNS